jgi:predicted transposase YdaD
MSRLDKLPVFLRKPIFQKLFEVAEYSNLTKEEQVMYDVALKRKWDNASVLESAKAEGKAEGKVEGKLEGKIEGKLEGKLEGKAEVVKNLLLDFGFTDEQAAQAAQVSLSFVQQVRADMAAKKK